MKYINFVLFIPRLSTNYFAFAIFTISTHSLKVLVIS